MRASKIRLTVYADQLQLARVFIGQGEVATDVLAILEIPRSTYYDSIRPTARIMRRGQPPPGYSLNTEGQRVSDNAIIAHLREYRSDVFISVEGGANTLSKSLKRDYGIIANHKYLARFCRQEGLELRQRRRKRTKFSSPGRNHEVLRLNQVWDFDLKYGNLHREMRFFLAAFIEVFNREILEVYSITPAMELTIRTDNGPHMRATRFAQ